VRQRSAKFRTARAVSRARRDFPQARKTASTTVWGLGVSASVFRDASVHLFYESSVHVHVVCPTSSISANPPPVDKSGVVRDFASVLVYANTRKTRRRTIRRRSGVSAAVQRHQAQPARDADAGASTAFLGFRARGPGAFPKASPTITYHTSISQRARSVLRCTCGRLSAKSADVVPRTVQEPLSATATQARRLDRRFPPGAWPRDGAVLWADIPTRRAARLGLDRARK
jgi:hypothetical protein